MAHFSLLFSLPEHLRITIAIRLARKGATTLKPLIACGRCGLDLAFHPHVLKAASLDYISLFYPSVVNEGSRYRAFVERCVVAGNPKACYLESLRLMVQDGAEEDSVGLLRNIESVDRKLCFAKAMVLFMSGREEEGTAAMEKFKSLVGSFDRAVDVIRLVFWDIDGIGSYNAKQFSTKWQRSLLNPPELDEVSRSVRDCTLCLYDESCPQCCKWWRDPSYPPLLLYPPARDMGCTFAGQNGACAKCSAWWGCN